MPEGDAVWRTARRLHQGLAGVALEGSDLRVPAHATADLSGRRTLEVVPRGKHLLHRVEGDITVHSHLRMEGSWRVHPVGRRHALGRRHTEASRCPFPLTSIARSTTAVIARPSSRSFFVSVVSATSKVNGPAAPGGR